MGRLVQPKRIAAVATAASAKASDTDSDYKIRVIKYIPAEVVAFYVAAAGIVPDDDPIAAPIRWALVGVGLVGTPVYLALSDKPKGKAWASVIISTIAFLLWAFALGGPFVSLPWYRAWLASLLILVFTFAIGAYQPKQSDPMPAPAQPA